MWSVSPRLLRYIKEQTLFCRDIRLLLTLTVQRVDGDDQTLQRRALLDENQCEELHRMLSGDDNATVVFEQL